MNIKNTLMIRYECWDIIWQRLFTSGYMVNQHHYQEILQHMRKTLNPKQLNDVTSRTGWFTIPMDQCTLHCQCSHFWLLTLVVVPHPHHSRDLAPFEFFFLPRMKSWLWWCSFQDASEIQDPLPTFVHVIPKCQFQQWQKPGTPYVTENKTTLKEKTTTNNKGKCIFHYQLRRGIFEQDLVHAKVKGFRWCASTQKYSQT